MVGEEVGFGEIRDADVGGQSVEVFALPRPRGRGGHPIGEGCGKRGQRCARISRDANVEATIDVRTMSATAAARKIQRRADEGTRATVHSRYARSARLA